MSLTLGRIVLVTLLCENGFAAVSRVNRGSPISIRDAPYMARVRIKQSATVGGACDGTILNPWNILTAGHCVTDEKNINVPNPPLHGPSNFSILIGLSNLNDEANGDGEVYQVAKVFFREFSSKNDLAILRLTSPMELDGETKMAATLPTNSYYRPKNRTEAHVDGWGTNPQNTEDLLRADVYTISVQECTTGADKNRDRTYQICTRGLNGAGPCQGDSGGPLLRESDGVQIGIASLAPSNCENPARLISTFTSVSRNLPWILSTMADDTDDTLVDPETATGYYRQTSTKKPWW